MLFGSIMVDKFLDMMKTWSPIGQGLFMLLLAGIVGYTVSYSFYALACALRGHEPKPPVRQ